MAALDDLDLQRALNDLVFVGFPGDRILLRMLDIPFAEAKKIGAVVGNELADDIPWEMEEVVFDYAALNAPQGKVLAVAAQTEEVGQLIRKLEEAGIEPRALLVAPLAYGALIQQIDPEGTVLVVDLGHTRTNICLVQGGRSLMGRTLSRAGHQLTEAFRQAFHLDYEEAEALKEQRAVLSAEEGLADLDPAQRPFAELTARAMTPLIRDLRLTEGLYSAVLGRRPDRVLLCGGTSLVSGLTARLGIELGLPVEHLSLNGASEFEMPEMSPQGEARSALALGLAMAQSGRKTLDLRQGKFAFKTDRSILSEKLVFLAVSLVVVLVFAAANAYMSLFALRKEGSTLNEQLKTATKAVFGEVITNPRSASRKVSRGCQAKALSIPTHSAFDILNLLSQQTPASDEVKLDITRLDIKQGKTFIKGTADTRSAVGDIAKALEKDTCFSKVVTGKISDVAEGKKQFSLTITTDCF